MPLKVFTLITISACVILASFDIRGHPSLFPLPKHYLPFFLTILLFPSLPACFNQSNVSPSQCYMGNKKDNGITHRLQHHVKLSSQRWRGCSLPFYAFVSFWKGIHVVLAETQPHVMSESSCWLQHPGHFQNASWHKSNSTCYFDVLVKLFPEVAVEVKLTSYVCASPFLGSFQCVNELPKNWSWVCLMWGLTVYCYYFIFSLLLLLLCTSFCKIIQNYVQRTCAWAANCGWRVLIISWPNSLISFLL